MRLFHEYNNVEFEVECSYNEYRPETYLQPPEGGYYDVYAIYWRGINVNQLFYNPELHLKEVDEEIWFGKHLANELDFLNDIKKPWEDFIYNFNKKNYEN